MQKLKKSSKEADLHVKGRVRKSHKRNYDSSPKSQQLKLLVKVAIQLSFINNSNQKLDIQALMGVLIWK